MIIECCSQERSYSTFYGLIGERFCKLNRVWTESFEQAFENYYTTIHRYETNRLRNIARFFGHLLSTDSISWAVFNCVKINEEDTTSSSRIFIKIMMGEMMESMGLKTLAERFKDEEVKRSCEGMFPIDVPKNTRFAINYFTSIGLGVVTDDMREYLKVRSSLPIQSATHIDIFSQNAPRLIMEQRRAMLEAESSSSDSSSDSDSDSDSDSSDSSTSDSRASTPHRGRRSLTPPPRRRGRSDSRSPPPRSRSRRRESSSPPPRRRYQDDSPPPPRRGGGRDRSPSPVRRRTHSPVSPPRRRYSPPPPRRDRDDGYERRREDSRDRGGRRSPPPYKRDDRMRDEPPHRRRADSRDRGYDRRR